MSKYHSYCSSSSSSCFSSQSFSHVDSCSPSPGVASWSATPWAPAGSPRAAARAEAREPRRRAWTRSWAPHFIRLEKSSMRRPEFKAGVWIWIWVILFDVWFWEIIGVFWRYFGNLDLGMWFDARRLRLERLQVTCNAANIVIVFLRDHSILHSLLQFLIAMLIMLHVSIQLPFARWFWNARSCVKTSQEGLLIRVGTLWYQSYSLLWKIAVLLQANHGTKWAIFHSKLWNDRKL